MRLIGEVLVFFLTIVHIGIVFLILIGWMFPGVFYLYGATLISTALSWVLVGRCVLVDVEFWLRKRAGLKGSGHKDSFTATFLNRLFKKEIVSDKFIYLTGVIVLSLSIPYWLYSLILLHF